MPATTKPGFRGPRRTLIGGFLALFVGSAAVVASFATIQAQGLSGFAMDVGGPLVNTVLGAAGEPRIDALSSEAESSSTLLIVAFVLGAMVATAGACLLVIGTLWTAVRGVRRTHAAATPVVTHAAREGGARVQRLRRRDPAQRQLAPSPVNMPVASTGLTTGDPLQADHPSYGSPEHYVRR